MLSRKKVYSQRSIITKWSFMFIQSCLGKYSYLNWTNRQANQHFSVGLWLSTSCDSISFLAVIFMFWDGEKDDKWLSIKEPSKLSSESWMKFWSRNDISLDLAAYLITLLPYLLLRGSMNLTQPGVVSQYVPCVFVSLCNFTFVIIWLVEQVSLCTAGGLVVATVQRVWSHHPFISHPNTALTLS